MLARLGPREVLVSETHETELRDLLAEAGAVATPLARASFDSTQGETRLGAAFGVAALDGFGAFTRPEVAALGALVDYLALTQKGRAPLLRAPVREVPGGLMAIDAATRRNLELTRALAGGREGALLATIDRTLTGAGGRLLEARLGAPSTDVAADPRPPGGGGAFRRCAGADARRARSAAPGPRPRACAGAAGARARRAARPRRGPGRARPGRATARRAWRRPARDARRGAGGARGA